MTERELTINQLHDGWTVTYNDKSVYSRVTRVFKDKREMVQFLIDFLDEDKND